MATEQDLEEARRCVDQHSGDGRALIRLCGDVLLQLNSPPQSQQRGLLEFYRRSLDLIGHSVRFVRNGEGARWKAAPKDLDRPLADWFDRPGRKASHVLTLESSTRADEVSDAAFEFSWVLGTGYVRLVLPTRSLVGDPERFAQTAAELASLVDYRSGTAGFSANIHIDHASSADDSELGVQRDDQGDVQHDVKTGCSISQIGRRYPGIDLGKPLYWSDFMAHGLKTVNWLTFLGPAALERLRGTDPSGEPTPTEPTPTDLSSVLGPELVASCAGAGQMIRAGSRPQLGSGPAADLAAYRQLARALHRLKIPARILRDYDGLGGTDNTRRWLDRFDT